MSLLKKLIENSTIKSTTTLDKSDVYAKQELISTPIPAINIALSGSIDGGLSDGLTIFAGPSKHFKTTFSLLLAKTYMDRYKDSVMLFYDSEFGAPAQYFENFDIDISRVIHTPITDIEQLKFDISKQLQEIGEKDKVVIVIDSVGNLASKKEAQNALDQNSAADMTRAKEMKSLFRIITPHMKIKHIPLIVINHTYKEMGLFPKDIVSGCTGIYYSADNIYIIGRQQDKDGKEVVGYNFIINVEKSRFVREKSKIPVSLSTATGIDKYSGLLDMAIEAGIITNPSKGWYQMGEEKFREKDFSTVAEDLLANVEFRSWVTAKYSLNTKMWSTGEDEDGEE
jgi:RecA/RadA recombinase